MLFDADDFLVVLVWCGWFWFGVSWCSGFDVSCCFGFCFLVFVCCSGWIFGLSC